MSRLRGCLVPAALLAFGIADASAQLPFLPQQQPRPVTGRIYPIFGDPQGSMMLGEQIDRIEQFMVGLELMGSDRNLSMMIAQLVGQTPQLAQVAGQGQGQNNNNGIKPANIPQDEAVKQQLLDMKASREQFNEINRRQAEMIRMIGSMNLSRWNREPIEVPIVERGRTGLMLVPVPRELGDHLKLLYGQGLMVRHVFPKTPAELVGYQKNDVIVEFAGKPVPSDFGEFLQKVMRFVKNDTAIDAVVYREGKRIEITGMKITEQRVIPILNNESYINPYQMIQVVPGINSINNLNTVRLPEYQIIRQGNTTTVFQTGLPQGSITTITPLVPNGK